ncbi:MAG: hypothetical protein E6296_05315 [Anaerococcus vaginalis]|nr:hypothetical protein [Anaerococcus vaginalis]
MKKVSKMDETDRNILLRSEGLDYKVAVISLSFIEYEIKIGLDKFGG